MGFLEASAQGFKRYFDFRTRSSRSEYWWFLLFCVLIAIILAIADLAFFPDITREFDDSGPLGLVWSLVTIIPSISISVRRLHDIDRSGWWYLLIFAIIIGWIVLLVWFCTRGTEGLNRFGDDPLGDSMDVFD